MISYLWNTLYILLLFTDMKIISITCNVINVYLATDKTTFEAPQPTLVGQFSTQPTKGRPHQQCTSFNCFPADTVGKGGGIVIYGLLT